MTWVRLFLDALSPSSTLGQNREPRFPEKIVHSCPPGPGTSLLSFKIVLHETMSQMLQFTEGAKGTGLLLSSRRLPQPSPYCGASNRRKLAQGPLSSQAVTCEHVLRLFLLDNRALKQLIGACTFFFFKELCIC